MLLVVLAASFFGWNWERSEQRAFTALALDPPGQMLHVGSHALHVLADGEGSPGVLFISGLGDDWRSWQPIADRLADSTRVVRYDRPGLGWSPPGVGSPTVDAAVDDIRALLSDTALFGEPPILVGHSLGGAIARQFALQYPSQVAGLVLLDPTPAHAMSTSMNAVGSMVYRLGAWSGAVGLTRWRHYRASPQGTRKEQLRSAFLNASGAKSKEVFREFRGAVESQAVEPRRGALGTMPLTLLAAPTFAPPPFASAATRMDAAKRLMAEESDRGRLVATETGHYIHWDDPDAVVAEVLRMLGMIRQESGSGEGGPTAVPGTAP
jgi:pimeloyl-ACP methyl ester carboxylesterase